jgi:hypothetical protein
MQTDGDITVTATGATEEAGAKRLALLTFVRRQAGMLALAVALGVTLTPALAPAQETASENTEEDADDPSRETDISEDNYRRFMELDDRRLERPAFPAAAIQPSSQLQKMGQLPESSQKHLRNQLRGIILARGDWTPEEMNRDYAFVPSAEARKDGQLLRDEIEAWTELVTEYHEREAAIYAAAAGSGAPGEKTNNAQNADRQTAPGEPVAGNQEGAGRDQAAAENPGGGQGNRGEGEQSAASDASDGARGRDAGEPPETRRTATMPPDPFAPESSSRGMSTEGVEQSASEYLQAHGYDAVPPSADGESSSTEGEDKPLDVGRWGEASQTLPPPIPAARMPALPDEVSATPEPANTLTLDELRNVRGVNEPADTGTPFDTLPVIATNPDDEFDIDSDREGGTDDDPDTDDDP